MECRAGAEGRLNSTLSMAHTWASIHKALWKACSLVIAVSSGGRRLPKINRNGWPRPELHLPAAHQKGL